MRYNKLIWLSISNCRIWKKSDPQCSDVSKRHPVGSSHSILHRPDPECKSDITKRRRVTKWLTSIRDGDPHLSATIVTCHKRMPSECMSHFTASDSRHWPSDLHNWPDSLYRLTWHTMGTIDSYSRSTRFTSEKHNIVHLHPVAHCYFTSTFIFRLLCGLLIFF
jgi:hypothetical protein